MTVDSINLVLSQFYTKFAVITQFPEELTTMDTPMQTECAEKILIESICIQTEEELTVDSMLECFIQTDTDDVMTVDASVCMEQLKDERSLGGNIKLSVCIELSRYNIVLCVSIDSTTSV